MAKVRNSSAIHLVDGFRKVAVGQDSSLGFRQLLMVVFTIFDTPWGYAVGGDPFVTLDVSSKGLECYRKRDSPPVGDGWGC